MFSRYFPYRHVRKNADDPNPYHSPLVAVRFLSLPVGQIIHVECRLWTKGQAFDLKRGRGGIQFQIFLDSDVNE